MRHFPDLLLHLTRLRCVWKDLRTFIITIQNPLEQTLVLCSSLNSVLVVDWACYNLVPVRGVAHGEDYGFKF